MNWLQIDKMIIDLLQAGNDPEVVMNDMKKQFKWTQAQAESAVKPLVSRMPVLQKEHKPAPKKRKPRKKLKESE
jgi:hypothetical protein